jgi:RNase H-like domain found in reverse transcriptase
VLRKVLQDLQDNNFTVKGGTRDGLARILVHTRRCQALEKEGRTNSGTATPKQLRSLFIGSVNFYREMFRKRSHILAPLTAQLGKRNIQWTTECQQAFDQIKALLVREAFLRFPDHNKLFHIYTDSSDVQMGSVNYTRGKTGTS